MKLTLEKVRSLVPAATAVSLLFSATAVFAQSGRLGGTFAPGPPDGNTRRFSGVAYDAANDAYLVVWGVIPIGARYVSAEGALLGTPVQVNTSPASRQPAAVRVACGAAINACLVAWIEENPSVVMGRLLRYSGGGVQFLTAPFVINQNGLPKLTSSAPGVAFSSGNNEFLVAWAEFGAVLDVKAQRVNASGGLAGGEIVIAGSGLYEAFPSLAYNSAQNEYLVAYFFESGSSSNVGSQRVQPGTGALIGGRSTIYGSVFDQYPEIAYNSRQNQYLAITWGFSGPGWMLHGGLADGAAQPFLAPLSLAAGGGGDGIGLAYNPKTNSYLAVYLSSSNDEIWGVEVNAAGVAGTQFQVTVSGTRLATQPRPAADLNRTRWLTVASDAFTRVMGQFVGTGPVPTAVGSAGGGGGGGGGVTCTTPQPAPDWVCVNGNWLPGTGGGGGGGGTTCTTPQPAPSWVCVNGNWLPGTGGGGGGGSSCTTVQPAPDWVCVNGNWLPGTGGGGGGGGGGTTCTTPQPAPSWVCVNGNWLPGTGGGGGGGSSCTTVQPAPSWVCVNGNWLPGTGGGGGGGSSCTTVQPAPDWVCVNGNWLPGTGVGGGGGSSCTTVQPAPNWVCVNGNWLPGTGGGGSSCTTVQPAPSWVCVNGNWLPGTGGTGSVSCPTIQPGPNWTCVNGNWLPIAMACSTVQPGPNWTCSPSTGNWLPPGMTGG